MPQFAVFSLAAAFFFALQYIFEKIASKHTIKTRTGLLFYLYLSFLPFTLALPFFVPIGWPQQALPYLLVHALLFFLGNCLFFSAIFKTDVSTFTPIFHFQVVFLAILAYLFLNEKFPFISYFWIGLMILGAVLVSFDEKMRLKSFWQKPVLLILASTVFYAATDLFAGFSLRYISFWTLTFWAAVIDFALASVVVIPFARARLKISLKQFSPMLLAGTLGAIAYTLLLGAYETNLTLSRALLLLDAPIVLLLSFLASSFKPGLLEHHPAKVYLTRALGIAIILLGTWKLSF